MNVASAPYGSNFLTPADAAQQQWLNVMGHMNNDMQRQSDFMDRLRMGVVENPFNPVQYKIQKQEPVSAATGNANQEIVEQEEEDNVRYIYPLNRRSPSPVQNKKKNYKPLIFIGVVALGIFVLYKYSSRPQVAVAAPIASTPPVPVIPVVK